MKRVLVTGVHGFIAGYVVEELKRRGYKVVGNVRSQELDEALKDPILSDVEIYNADIMNSEQMLGIIQHVDGVIHLAGLLGTTENMESCHEMINNNIHGGLNVIRHCSKHSVPLVLIGVGNFWENNPYSITKTAVEKFGRMFVANDIKAGGNGVWINIVRAMNAIGPRQKAFAIKKVMPTFIKAALKNEPINVYGGKSKCSEMDLVYAGDVAIALADVLEKTMNKEYRGKTFVIGSGKAPKVWDIAETVKRLAGSGSEIVEVPMRRGETENSRVCATLDDQFSGSMQEFMINKPEIIVGKADLDQVILDTINYYRDHLE